MNVHPLRLITVSREFGAGGSELARELGARLGWPVLDHDIVHRVATRLRMDAETVEHFDEHAPSLLARIATVLIVPQPDLYAFPPLAEIPSHDAIAAAATRVIEEAVAAPPLIVVGHGAQCILAGRPDALHLRVVAPVEARLQRVTARLTVDAADAGSLVRRADHDRRAYLQRYFQRDWDSALLYDLQFNTGRVAVAEGAAIVAQLVAARSGGDAEPSATSAESGGAPASGRS
ncbi:MAG TPA: cytidylate kinase-like family protein [Gemmatimonadaceae bacterium]|nr:cytidylate kinase-like family protein [Gemmatimonadaceae bacterium]